MNPIASTRVRRTLALACALALSLCLLASCGSSEEVAPAVPAYESPYDFAGLANENGRFVYRENGEVRSKIGIDVSEHQGAVDWNAVAADGIEFAFIRVGNRGATEGVLSVDDQFAANLHGARAAGIPVGVYFFSQAVNADEALEEARFVLEQLDGAPLDYPVVYDHEPVTGIEGARANDLSRAQLTENTRVFADAVAGAGYTPMVYGNKSDVARLDLADLPDLGVWFAEYDVPAPTGQFDFTIWQYTNNGTVAGIDTRVDMNIQLVSSL